MALVLGAFTIPNWQAWAVIGLLLLMVVLFATERFRVDVVGLLGVSALMLLRILTPDKAFAGFGSSTIVMLGSVFLIGGALQETGVLEWIGSRAVGYLPRGEFWLVLGFMLVASVLSAFMNNTSVTAMLVPMVSGLSRRTGVSLSRLLMPMAFAAILGGTCTLIGTSTNVAVSGYLSTHGGLAPLGLFETTSTGIILVAAGILFMLFVGRHFLPQHPEEDLADDFGIRGFLSEIVLLPGSPLIGRPIVDSDLARMEFHILKIVRGDAVLCPMWNRFFRRATFCWSPGRSTT